jgi:release factor glutamine methyltransferase
MVMVDGHLPYYCKDCQAMNNSKLLFQDFIKAITLPESREEISGIAYLVFEDLFGLSKTQILTEKNITISSSDQARLTAIIARINQHEPVQYILGGAEFFGRRFKVNPAVLIPRPETEELVRTVLDSKPAAGRSLKILDIGTGSGCIPVTLALEMDGAEVFATDISPEALTVAKENATKLNARVTFLEHDILREEIAIGNLDVVVSNPPYILPREQKDMKKNVVDHEPHLALFTPENDPLIFYRSIAGKAKAVLKKGGLLCVEINEQYGDAVRELFSAAGYDPVQIVRDLSGKNRIVKGSVKG